MSVASSFREIRRRVITCVAASILVCCLSTHADAQSQTLSRTVTVNIPPQSISTALLELSKQAGIQVLMPGAAADQQSTRGVQGEMSVEQALSTLLDGTTLRFRLAGENAIGIESMRSSATSLLRIAEYRAANDQQGVTNDQQGLPAPSRRADDTEVTEVVVTATKRAERLIDVPTSISAYGADELQQRAIRSIADIAAISPGVNFTSGGAYSKIAIRGISSPSVTSAGTATTALYLDEIPVQVRSGLGAFRETSLRTFDLERVEVLRGPQGTLFGASAMGGAIRFITPQPSLTDFSGYAQAEIADTRGGGLSHEAGVAVGGPIIADKLGFRISGWHRHDGGFIDHSSVFPSGVREQDADSADSYVARGALAFVPNDVLRFTASVYVQDIHEHDLSMFHQEASDPDSGRFVKTDLLAEPIRDEFVVPSLKIEAELGWADLTSITTYLNREFAQLVDYTDVIPAARRTPPATSAEQYQILGQEASQKTLVQEVRVGSPDSPSRLKWNIGVYYSELRQDGLQTIEAPSFGGALVDGIFSFHGGERFRDQKLAGFGNFDYELFRGLSVTAGVRVSTLENHYESFGAGPLFGPANTFTRVQKEDPVTPKFGINYKPSENSLLYILAAKGYRAGGTNQPFTAILTASEACLQDIGRFTSDGELLYDSDSLWSYEAGWKSSFLEGRLALNASVYHIDWTDIQRFVSIPSCSKGFTANFGSAESNGFDLAIDARLSDSLTANLVVGYTSAKSAELVTLAGRTYAQEGEQLADIPPWTIVAALQYDFRITPTADGYVRAENRYSDRNDGRFPFLNPANNGSYRPGVFGIDEARNELNIRAGLIWGKLDVSAFVMNALNAHPLDTVVAFRGDSRFGAQTIRPMTIGLSSVYRW